MSGAAHTPGPWAAEPLTGRGAWIKGTDGGRAAMSCGQGAHSGEAEANGAANAAFIVRACNAHDAAYEALVLAVGTLIDVAPHAQGVIQQGQAAIAKMEGRT
jgi:hypothetical protein